jgi:hypothetical protein
MNNENEKRLTLPMLQTMIVLRESHMYPKTVEEFMDAIRKLDEKDENIERILKREGKITFSLSQYYNKNKDMIPTIISLVI